MCAKLETTTPTGFAPIKAMIEQQLKLTPQRDMLLFWGVASAQDLYDLDQLRIWNQQNPSFHYGLAVERRDPDPALIAKAEPISIGYVSDVVTRSAFEFGGRDAYVAGPPEMITAVADALQGTRRCARTHPCRLVRPMTHRIMRPPTSSNNREPLR